MEVSVMSVYVDSLQYIKTKGISGVEPPECYVQIPNTNLQLHRSGKYVLVRRKPIPYAWRNLVDDETMEVEYVGVQIYGNDK